MPGRFARVDRIGVLCVLAKKDQFLEIVTL